MSRLATSQSPEWCYEMLGFFREKLARYASDVTFLYTNGLYFNSMEISYENRKRTNQQVINHNAALRNLIEKQKDFIPGAIHYLPIDFVLLNAPEFHSFFGLLKKQEETDEAFKAALAEDSGEREYNEANVNFLLEEIVIAHLIRQGLATLPKTLVDHESWRLIAYPGTYLHADVYQWQKKVLPQAVTDNPFAGAQYDTTEQKLHIFGETPVAV